MADLKQPLSSVEFIPLDEAGASRHWRVSPLWLGIATVLTLAALVLVYLLLARAVIFRIDPTDASLEVSGLAFHIGHNYLLLPGHHELRATAEGYHPLDTAIDVAGEGSQEITLALEPLPGRLDVRSALDGIEVYIDQELRGVAPGVVEDIARGPHIVEFRKHRYFPLQQELDIEGRGRTQSLTVELERAWGQLEITSVPEGAAVKIDGTPVGTTPLATEVLETGTLLTIEQAGYKTWEREVSVKAGTSAAYPPIELVIADGTVDVSSSPAGAHVSADGEFRGVTPLRVELSPLRDHRLELFLEGYRKAVRTVRTEPEGHAALNVDLEPIIGRVRLSVSPPDAEVVVDGRLQGTGSQTLALTAREHEVTVRKAGFEPRTQRITPRVEHEQSLDIRLLTIDQAYWATRPPRIEASVGAELKLFRPADAFTMGAARREPGRRANEAERNVRLERPFYLGLREITNGQFRRFRGEHTSSAVRGKTLDMDDQPAVKVSWNDAALFCNWLSLRDGLPPFYLETNGQVTAWDPDAHGYRLPTEAEWAFAARMGPDGSTLMFPWGTELYPPPGVVENYADLSAADIVNFVLSNYDDGFPASAPVGSFQPNQNGFYDMSGNVSEWINDYFEIRPVRGEPLLDPLGPDSGDRHVIRGASWARASRSELRLAYRESGVDGNLEIGFRIARYVDKARAEP